MLNAFEPVHKRGDLMGILPVHQDHFGLGVLKDVSKFRRGETIVEGHQHSTELRHGKERLQDTMAVRRQHRDFIALGHAQVPQSVRQTMHTRFQVAVGRTPCTINHCGLVREQPRGAAQKVQR